jgi:hypothetical protein
MQPILTAFNLLLILGLTTATWWDFLEDGKGINKGYWQRMMWAMMA